MHITDPAIKPIRSSFLSVEKDMETIIRKVFAEHREVSDALKRLLVVNTEDCLDTSITAYNEIVNSYDVGRLKKEGYIRLAPKITFGENEEVKSYILITMDRFTPNTTNPQFRDCFVSFDILCHPEYWDLGDYKLRPLKIAGYVDGILDGCKLSGIGTFQFASCNEIVLDQNLSGYSLTYAAIHGAEDWIPGQ